MMYVYIYNIYIYIQYTYVVYDFDPCCGRLMFDPCFFVADMGIPLEHGKVELQTDGAPGDVLLLPDNPTWIHQYGGKQPDGYISM